MILATDRLTNHLGSLLQVVSDRKLPVNDGNENIDCSLVDVVSYSDYYPGGMVMPGRAGSANSYDYGFNGMLKDDEVKGEGNSYDFGARMYDPRVMRWLSLDPAAKEYPSMSDYSAMGNNPILNIDPSGEKIYIFYDTGEVDENNKPIFKSYEYKSGLKLPKDKFVKKTVRTLKKLERKGFDKGVISEFVNSETNNVAIFESENWKSSGFIISVGETTYVGIDGESISFDENSSPDIISWNTNTGIISSDGKKKQGAALVLLHEIGHKYYDAFDPENKKSGFSELTPEQKNEFYEKEAKEVGNYRTYADKWIITNLENNFKGGGVGRKSHSEGFRLKTYFGAFSKIGFKYASPVIDDSGNKVKNEDGGVVMGESPTKELKKK